ncbi:MAG: hypothetical protein J0I93_12465 [Legionella sp.]|nr:hypothetical protein [Legionella sp.]
MMLFQNIRLSFKKIIILFWCLWWLIALWTDILGLLAHYHYLNKSWAPDGNMPFLIQSLAMYPLPAWAPLIFFLGILLWSLVSTLSFIWASLSLNQPFNVWMRKADIAFIISLSYWLAFFIADQMVMKYDLEQNHMVQGGFQLLCYLTLYLLPNKSE